MQAISASIRALLSKKSDALPRPEGPFKKGVMVNSPQSRPGMWHFLFTHLLRPNLGSLNL